MLGIFRQCNSLQETLVYKTMTQPSLIFFFQNKKPAPLSPKTFKNVHAFTKNSNSHVSA